MKRKSHSLSLGRSLFYLMTFLVLTTFTVVSCSKDQIEIQSGDDLIELSQDLPEVQAVMAIQDRHTEALMSNPGVVGTATGVNENGQLAVLVMVKDQSVALDLPESLDNVPVAILVTGEIKELKGGPPTGGGFDPTNKHRPAPNGVSLGHPDITAGTLGCLVTKGGTTYILSNNHVMANENQSSPNAPILQPGPFDGGIAADQIATLSDWVDIIFSTSANNVVDAAIAAVNPADVTGETVSYGAPLSTTVSAAIRMSVTKYGRTTSSTTGKVQGLNATVNVGYDTGTARFVDQIVIGGGGFSSGGDSGSLIVVNNGSDANKPVGLLFAGGGGSTIANPIDDVLGAFGVTISGSTGSGSN